MPTPANGQLLVRTLYLSLDPYMRMAISLLDSNPVAVGQIMPAEVVAEVTQSRDDDYRPGDLVRCMVGWCSHSVVNSAEAHRVSEGPIPVTAHLGVLGMPGFAAYLGMKIIGRPKAGESLVVAAAAGPVGSLVGQLARLAGARVVGIAGGAVKCDYLVTSLGFDAAVDRHQRDWARSLKILCPSGIDIYFENVGGAIWEAVLPLLNPHARVPVCGLVAHYGGSQPPSAPSAALTILQRSLLIQGFIYTEFLAKHFGEFISVVKPMVLDGRILYRERIIHGLEAAPRAFIEMLEGRGLGKLLVKVA